MRVFGNDKVTSRDVSFLAAVRGRGGACTIADLRGAFAFLAPDAVESTVAKLARRRLPSLIHSISPS